MKRRKFLSLIGAATTAPLLPVPGIAAATTATATAPYSAAAVHGAILHAQSSRYVSAWGLSKVLKLPIENADALMSELQTRGIIAPVSGARRASRWAASRVHHPLFARHPRKPARKASQDKTRQSTRNDHTSQPDTNLLMAHLRDITSRYFASKPQLIT